MGSAAHEDYQRHAVHRVPSNRSFAWVMAAAFAVLAVKPLLKGQPLRWWAVAAAAFFLTSAALFPSVLTPLNKAWMGLAELLSRVVNPIVMAALFYAIFTPIAVLGRLFGRDPLRMKADPKAKSYWIRRNDHPMTSESLKNQF